MHYGLPHSALCALFEYPRVDSCLFSSNATAPTDIHVSPVSVLMLHHTVEHGVTFAVYGSSPQPGCLRRNMASERGDKGLQPGHRG